MFRNIQCFNTLNGKLLTWDILEGHKPTRISVYGTYEGKGWTLLEDNCEVGYFLDSDRTLGLQTIYKLVGVDNVGNRHEVDNIGATSYDSKAGIVAKELVRRETVMYKSHPYGRADVILLMHKSSGTPCSSCGTSTNCPTEGTNEFCTECYGTGYKGGYVKYPKKIHMMLVNAHDDIVQPVPEVSRNGAVQAFRTTFTGMIREKDILCVGMDFYKVQDSKCVASVGTIPVVYNITAFKLLPEDVRYSTLLERLRNGK